MKQIEQFSDLAQLNAAGLPTTESRVAQVVQGNAVAFDGVNIEVNIPQVGDAVYVSDSDYHFFRGGARLNHSRLISAGLTSVGDVIGLQGDYAVVRDKHTSNQKYLDVCQYAITAITSTSLAIKLRMSPDYAVDTTVEVTLSEAAINATTAAEISAAVSAKATEVGDKKAWWAYLADNDGNKVDEGGTRIIIQCDTCVDYRFYNCSATGCTIRHITWGDMPENSSYLKVNGKSTNYRGLMNIARGKAYWSTGSKRELTANVAVHSEAGNTDPMKLTDFQTSEYAAAMRAYYGTYEKYLRGEFGIVSPQRYGCFGLPSGKELTLKYALKTAPTKDGGEKYKFPFLNWCYNHTYGIDGLDFGDFFAPGVREGVQMMADETLLLVNPTATKMGNPVISNSTYRWWAQRYNVYNAWFFNGNYGNLNSNNVNYAYLAQAAALLKIKR